MARIQPRPTTFFSLSPATSGKALCFAVQRGAVQRRSDPGFHATPDFGALIKSLYADTHSLASFCDFIDSGRPILSRLLAGGIPAYEVGHVLPGELKATDIFVSPDSDRILAKHDLLTGRVGGLGAFAEYTSDNPASFSDNTLRLRPQDHEKARARFVSEYLNSRIGNTQLLRDSRGSLQKVVTQESLGTIIVPRLGHRETTLLAIMDTARAQKRKRLEEADALLAGLDDFLLAALGLPPPPKHHRSAFAASVGEAREQSHLNADYFHPERILALRAMRNASRRVPCARLVDVVAFIRNQLKTPGPHYLSLGHVQSNTGELVRSDETATGACFTFQASDVLFARLRPYLNKVHCAETNGCCSTEFHVLRVLDSGTLLPDYLAAVLRSILTLAQTRHMMTGNTHPRLSNEDVYNLVLPIPKDVAIQRSIVAEARRRRDTARRLRTAAEAELQAATRDFEAQLLGGAR